MKDLMTKLAVVATASAALSFAVSDSASAVPILSGDNPHLSTILNNPNVGVDANVNVQNDQSGVELWTNADNPTATLIIEVAGFANQNKFGLYNSAGTLIELFAGGATQGNTVTATFSGSNVTVGSQTFNNFGNTFGFYLTSPVANGTTFYTEKSKNGGKDQAVTYQGNGTVLDTNIASLQPSLDGRTFISTDYIIAWEDKIVGGSGNKAADGDYNDMVVFVKDIEAVPEPLTMLGVGTAIGFGGFFKRELAKKQKKDKTKA